VGSEGEGGRGRKMRGKGGEKGGEGGEKRGEKEV